MHVLYYQQKKEDILGGHGEKVRYVLKRRRFMIGKNTVKDLTDGVGCANPLIIKSMRTRNKELIINGPDFNLEKVTRMGGFLSKKFWSANLLWGSSDHLVDNLLQTVRLLRAELPVVQAAVGNSTKKLPNPNHKPLAGQGLVHRFKKKGVTTLDKVTITTSSPAVNCDEEFTTEVI